MPPNAPRMPSECPWFSPIEIAPLIGFLASRIDCYVHVNFVHEENTQLNFLHSQQILTKRQSSKASRSLGDVPPGVEPRNPSSMQY